MLIEVLMSALILAIAAVGVFALLQSTVRTQAEQRHSTEAYALAQEDQARLASMRLGSLNRLAQENTITLNRTEFTVHSYGRFVNDKTSTPSCGEGTSTADYVEITSEVKWPGMNSAEKAKIVSILSPSNGSLDPSRGTFAVRVTGGSLNPVPNVSVEGTNNKGGTFSGTTDEAGCVVFAEVPTVPTGNYKITLSGASEGLVNMAGAGSETVEAGVKPGETVTVARHFDRPGSLAVDFNYRVGDSSEKLPAEAEAVMLRHSLMGPSRVFKALTGDVDPSFPLSGLYPFDSAYSVYAGACSGHDPNPSGETSSPYLAATATPLITRDGLATATIQLPVLEVNAWTGHRSSSQGSAYAGADVWVVNGTCSGDLTRRYTTDANGKAFVPLPWGAYDLCVDTRVASGSSSGVRRDRNYDTDVNSLTNTTASHFYLGSGSGAASESDRSCP